MVPEVVSTEKEKEPPIRDRAAPIPVSELVVIKPVMEPTSIPVSEVLAVEKEVEPPIPVSGTVATVL